MRCGACGADNRTGAKFCHACGQPLSAATGQMAPSPEFAHQAGAGPGGAGWQPSAPASEPTAAPRAPIAPVPAQALSADRAVADERKEIRGQVRGSQQRSEQMMTAGSGAMAMRTTIVWTFRIERTDARGNRLQPVPVEMRSSSFEGMLADGDWVVVPGPWHPGELLRPRRVYNETTGATVQAKGPSRRRMIITSLVVLIVGLAFMGAIVMFGFSQQRQMEARFNADGTAYARGAAATATAFREKARQDCLKTVQGPNASDICNR